MNLELLEQPFSTEQIQQRVGNFGKTLDYIEGHAVIQRLNDAFDGQWSFQVKSHDVLESEVIVLGELTAENITKSQFGSSTVTRAKNSGEIISLADDLKSSSTDCMKKCATLFGVGLHLYTGHSGASNPSTKATPQVIKNDPFASDASGGYISGSGGGRSNDNANSGKQLYSLSFRFGCCKCYCKS